MAMTITEGKPIKEFKVGWVDIFSKTPNEYADLYRFRIPTPLLSASVNLENIVNGNYKEDEKLWTF